MSAGQDFVSDLVTEWQALRLVIQELEAAEHPDVVDVDGRVWTWWQGEVYRTPRPDLYPPSDERPEGGMSAVPLALIRVAAEVAS